MKNRGYAMSAIVYPILLICLILVVSLLFNYQNKLTLLEQLKSEVKDNILNAESISISGENELVGRAIQLTATVLPINTTNKTVIWTSSDTKVATVDNTGLVTGVGDGTVTITGTTSNGLTATKEITVSTPLCVRALTFHTEICTQTDGTYYCSASGYATGSTITYGNQTVEEGKLNSGDAFDCDVNGDGNYDSETERFYYVSGLNGNNTSDIKVLIYYNNTSRDSNDKIQPDNTSSSTIAYYPSVNENWHGPTEAIKNLPTINDWSNVRLSNTSRNITNESGGTTTNNGSKTIENPFSYKSSNNVDYAARLLTYQEVATACGGDGKPTSNGELEACNYLMENTKYSASTIRAEGYWLETPNASNSPNAWNVNGINRHMGAYMVSYAIGIRPAIEVSKSDIIY